MPRTLLATQPITEAGIVPAYTAANALGHSCAPETILHVKNGGASPINVTIQTGATGPGGRAIADDVVAVANASEKLIGLADRTVLSRAATDPVDPGLVWVDFSAVTSVTVALFAG